VTTFVLNDKAYKLIKLIAQIILPGLGTLYAALAGFWGLPNVEQVVGTIVAVDTFLGLLLAQSSKSYYNGDAPYDGDMVVHPAGPDGKQQIKLELNSDPAELLGKDQVSFKVLSQEVPTTPGDLPPVPPM